MTIGLLFKSESIFAQKSWGEKVKKKMIVKKIFYREEHEICNDDRSAEKYFVFAQQALARAAADVNLEIFLHVALLYVCVCVVKSFDGQIFRHIHSMCETKMGEKKSTRYFLGGLTQINLELN